jgi:hypothetical protein
MRETDKGDELIVQHLRKQLLCVTMFCVFYGLFNFFIINFIVLYWIDWELGLITCFDLFSMRLL